jgi:hypothetical protein
MQSTTRTVPSAVACVVEHQRIAAVAALHGRVISSGSQAPPAVVTVAEQGGETGSRIEAWQAQPVDRPVSADARRGLRVADHGVVLDPHPSVPVGIPCGCSPRPATPSACLPAAIPKGAQAGVLLSSHAGPRWRARRTARPRGAAAPGPDDAVPEPPRCRVPAIHAVRWRCVCDPAISVFAVRDLACGRSVGLARVCHGCSIRRERSVASGPACRSPLPPSARGSTGMPPDRLREPARLRGSAPARATIPRAPGRFHRVRAATPG